MNKSTKGLLLLAVAAGLGWMLWRRRQTPEARTGTQTDSLANIGQLGGDVNQNITPSLVDSAFKFATEQIERNLCWQAGNLQGQLGDAGLWFFHNSAGQVIQIPAGTYPPNYCGNR